jgi:hypothetical protein
VFDIFSEAFGRNRISFMKVVIDLDEILDGLG